ncbi:hypothetical protein AVEN_259697-1 [Araneus ventricosus]|uniref:Uncharacterized protein n=1 Tax=Araneus ventricosus TaxID=182803 RepID=A0A4Y2PMV0_ARAVE|nr:hypothetical protein AVEN_259697-1 [Araneus ventricosus]
MFKDHIPNFIPVALIVFELSCSQKHIIPKLCFSDSGRSKTWGSVKISSSNFLTITILSLCILRIRESKHQCPVSEGSSLQPACCNSSHSSLVMGETGPPGLQPRSSPIRLSSFSCIEVSTIGMLLPKQWRGAAL